MGGASGDGGDGDCSAKVQIGAELLCKGGKVEPEYRVRRTESKGGPETGMLAGAPLPGGS